MTYVFGSCLCTHLGIDSYNPGLYRLCQALNICIKSEDSVHIVSPTTQKKDLYVQNMIKIR